MMKSRKIIISLTVGTAWFFFNLRAAEMLPAGRRSTRSSLNREKSCNISLAPPPLDYE